MKKQPLTDSLNYFDIYYFKARWFSVGYGEILDADREKLEASAPVGLRSIKTWSTTTKDPLQGPGVRSGACYSGSKSGQRVIVRGDMPYLQ